MHTPNLRNVDMTDRHAYLINSLSCWILASEPLRALSNIIIPYQQLAWLLFYGIPGTTPQNIRRPQYPTAYLPTLRFVVFGILGVPLIVDFFCGYFLCE